MRRCLLVVALALGCWTCATPARAGTYEVDFCHTPYGGRAETAGWAVMNPSSAVWYRRNCDAESFGVATKADTGPFPAGFITGWRYVIPSPLSVVGYAGGWTVFSSRSTGWSWYGGMGGRLVGEPNHVDVSVCNASGCGDSGWYKTVPPLEEVTVGVQCNATTSPCPKGSGASIDVQWLRLKVSDAEAPSIAATSGATPSTALTAGVGRVDYRSSDRGVGVSSVRLEVDGRMIASRSVRTDVASCVTPTTVLTACPAAVSGSFSVDTRKLADGPHTFRLIATDLAQNSSIRSWTSTLANHTLATTCGSQPGTEMSTVLKPRRPSFGKAGHLYVAWETMPWSNAEAVLFEGDDVLVPVRSGVRRGNRYVFSVPPGTSRAVRVGFRARGSRGMYACTFAIPVAVRARLTLRATPRLLANGRRVRLTGRLAGGVSAAKRTVVIEARSKGGRRRWTPVKVTRTDRLGHFRFRYRFTRTTARTRFVFRARVAASRGFPYAPSSSRERTVTVVP